MYTVSPTRKAVVGPAVKQPISHRKNHRLNQCEDCNDNTSSGSTEHQGLVKGAEQQTDISQKISACAKHFQYIATLSSFEDENFKNTIQKELQDNPDISWRALMSLSVDLV